MSENWNEVTDPPATGHAAVGFVVGQRYGNTKPDKVKIKYVDEDGDILEAVVMRETSMQQVEYSESDKVRFALSDGSPLTVSGIVAARPILELVEG